MKLRYVAGATALALTVAAVAFAQSISIPQVSAVGANDLFADIVNGVPGAGSVYASAPTLASFVASRNAGVNAQTGTSYTFLTSDVGKLVTFSNASPVAVTLPQAGSGGWTGNIGFEVENIGAGTVTITPTTSTIDGNATMILAQNQGARIWSDGTNWLVQRGMGGGALSPTYVASAVNFFQLQASATGGAVKMLPAGTDNNISTLIGSKGTGSVFLGGPNGAAASVGVQTVAGSLNLINMAGATTGNAPAISVAGTGADTNANLSVAGKGTGIVQLGQAICTISGTSPQTCNGQRGIVTTGTLSTAHNANASFTVTNSSVSSTSLVICTINSYSGTISTNGVPVITQCVPGSGSFVVNIFNADDTNALNGTVGIGFAVLN